MSREICHAHVLACWKLCIVKGETWTSWMSTSLPPVKKQNRHGVGEFTSLGRATCDSSQITLTDSSLGIHDWTGQSTWPHLFKC